MILRALICAGVTLLSACVAIKPAPEHARVSWDQRSAQLDQITRFSLQARISASGPTPGKANLTWRQRPQDFDLRLSGPFGVGGIGIAGDEHRVDVRSKDQHFVTDDPEAYLQSQLGWTLPLARLRWWVLGLPAPQSMAQLQFDPEHRVAALVQDGWRLSYEEYQLAGHFDLPRKIALARDDLKLRVVIDAWSDLPTIP